MAGSQVSSVDSATLNSLPAWYTDYGQSITGAGLGALNNDVLNYKGAVDQNGNPLPRVAGMTGQQQQAQAQVGANQGNWLPELNTGSGYSSAGFDTVAGASPTFQQALGQTGVANGTYGNAAGVINGAGGNFDSAGNYIGGASGNFDSGEGMINGATGNYDAAGNYIGSASNNFGAAGTGFGNAAGVINNSAIPTLNGGANYLGANGASGALSQAGQMLNPAFSTATAGSGTIMDPANQAERDAWMNPYTGRVADSIANLANQNLMENVIPNINSTFVGAGQFGSTRNGDFMNHAVRDNQQAITNADAQMLLQAQQAADQAYGQEKSRQLAGAQTMGGLSQVGANIGNAYTNVANANTNIGNGLTSAGNALTNNAEGQTNLGTAVVNQGNAMANLGNDRVNQGTAMAGIGNDRVNQGQAMTNVGLGRVSQGNALTGVANGQGALAQIMAGIGNDQVNQGQAMNGIGLTQAQLAQMRQGMGINDVNALLTTGGLEQQTNQKGLDASLADFMDRRDFPLQTLGGLSQLLPNVSGKIVPDQQTSSVTGIPNNADPYKNIQDIINIINGVGK